ncbi:MAG: FAD-binding oxidoreductase [Candidatus Lernaella stagnicola]|nr:FAD-binding oxidoreductase [Candidatus Lernaella stagnicola]
MSTVLLSMLVVGGIGAVLAVALEVADRYIANYGECTIDINDGKREVKVDGGGSLLSALVGEGIFIPSACGGRGSCGYCRCGIDEGGGPVLPTEESWLSPDEVASNMRISCQVKVRNDMRIRIPEKLFSISEYEGVVKRITELTYDIKEVLIELVDPPEIDYQTGEYMQLQTPEYGDVDESVYRAYSMSSVAADKRHVEFIIRRVPDGICTTWVHDHLKEGDEVTVNGPHGDFFLRETDAPIIMIAGGSGMAPFKGMLREMAAAKNPRPVRFFFGANTERDVYHTELMQQLESEIPDFKFIPALFKPEGDWKGETGLITEAVDRLVEADLAMWEGYLCGSPGMIDACVEVLKKHGLPEDNIYFDKFS